MTTFPLYKEELAKVLGVSVEWCEDMHYGMPCAIRLGDGVWWVDNDASLEVWRKYADVWKQLMRFAWNPE